MSYYLKKDPLFNPDIKLTFACVFENTQGNILYLVTFLNVRFRNLVVQRNDQKFILSFSGKVTSDCIFFHIW